jgi:hypothetical protein
MFNVGGNLMNHGVSNPIIHTIPINQNAITQQDKPLLWILDRPKKKSNVLGTTFSTCFSHA